jgi:hypothetical protein
VACACSMELSLILNEPWLSLHLHARASSMNPSPKYLLAISQHDRRFIP